MNKKVLILMSTFNGGQNIIRQVNSILEQENVDIYINIRDDGSDEDTIKVLQKLMQNNCDRIKCIYGKNLGWKRSFMELIYSATLDFDYFGFSDQDDLWMADKIYSCIRLMENDSCCEVKLAHCNSLSVDKKLRKRKEQEIRIPCPSSYKTAFATEYFQGCGMIWNSQAMRLICSYRPHNVNLAHDYWVGLICYLFGKIYFCKEPKFYHIRYDNNSSEDGNVKMGRCKRLKLFLQGKNVYMNPVEDLNNGFKELLKHDEVCFINRVISYRNCIKDRILLLVDYDFRRPSVLSTILLKIYIILKKY